MAIARTLAPEPSVLFMDEPLSNLDAKLRLEMRYELQRLHVETGSTFVYVTHDQMEAMTLATQICLIENGVLQQYDAPLTVYHQPNNLFVADFVGNPSINFVEAKGRSGPTARWSSPCSRAGKHSSAPAPRWTFPVVPGPAPQAAAWEEAHRKRAAEKSYVEKGNKDEAFRYHIAKVVERRPQDERGPTDPDRVPRTSSGAPPRVGIRPEFSGYCGPESPGGEIYGAMPTGMESTIKVRVDDFLLTGVIFGSSLFTIGEKVPVTVSGDNIMLFHRKAAPASPPAPWSCEASIQAEISHRSVFSDAHVAGETRSEFGPRLRAPTPQGFFRKQNDRSPMGLPVVLLVDSYFRITASSLSNAEAL